MDWRLTILFFFIVVFIVWWALSRQTEEESGEHHTEEPASPPGEAAAPDDLARIEGIGPKVAELLKGAGIETFKKLADSTKEELEAVLDPAGGIYKAMDPTSWPQQAGLAATGKWEELKKLQDELNAGR